MNPLFSVTRHNTADAAIQRASGTEGNNPQSFSATIANGATDSSVIDVHNYGQGGFAIPSAFTGASVSFKVSDLPNGTFQLLYDSSNALVSQTVGTSRSYAFPAGVFSFGYVKIVSASSEGAARSITYHLKF